MSDVINISTKTIQRSVNTADYPPKDWLKINRTAALSAEAIPQKYRKIVSGTVVEMTTTEKAVVDQAARSAVDAKRATDSAAMSVDAKTLGNALIRAGVITKTQLKKYVLDELRGI